MLTEPILVVMAAGMGSRYGGLKQIDPVGSHGESILDYSLYDAYRASFRKAVIIIKEAIRADFMATVGARLKKCPMQISYAFQELDTLPEGFSVPKGRVKPYGTAHAVLCAKDRIGDAPFAVINSDDYYGVSAFRTIYQALCQAHDGTHYDFYMVGYYLCNTLSENGGVSRGICQTDDNGFLTELFECVGIERNGENICYPLENGRMQNLESNVLVSMNMFGFTPSMLRELEASFLDFLKNDLPNDPMKAELYLPVVVSNLIQAGKASVKVLSSADRWYGVTYAADKPFVVDALARLTAQGVYPDGLWE